jgi:hypothetical protein
MLVEDRAAIISASMGYPICDSGTNGKVRSMAAGITLVTMVVIVIKYLLLH